MSSSSPRPFVGRERDVAFLTDALERAIEGMTGLVLVSGEPGIGKTSLVEELHRKAAQHGVVTLWGRAWEGGRAPAFWPWMTVLRDVSAGARDVLSNAPELLHLLPDLRDPASAVAPAPATDERGRFELLRQAADLLRHAARSHPLLVVLDDIHAADEASLTLLRFAAQALTGERVLFVAMYRSADAKMSAHAQALAELTRDAELITVDGLSELEVGRLLTERLGSKVPEGLVSKVHRATAGNPFFVEQMAEAIASPENPTEQPLPVPEAVRMAVRRNLTPLPTDCTNALHVAAVLGGRFDMRTLAELLDLDGSGLLDLIEPALSHGLLVRTDEPSTLAFRHSLVRESLYEDAPPADLLRTHLRVAQTLEKLHGIDPDPQLTHIAHHYLRALPLSDRPTVIRYAIGAAEWAASVAAWDEAASYYQQALDVAEETGDDGLVLRILCDLSAARTRNGDLRSSNELGLRAIRLAGKLGEPLLLVRAAASYSHALPYGVADAEAVRVFSEAAAAIGPEHPGERAMILSRLAVQLTWAGDDAGAQAAAREAASLAGIAEPAPPKLRALIYIHRAVWGPDSLDRRLAEAPAIVRLAGDAGDLAECAEARAGLMISLLEAGAGPAADRELEEAVRLAELSRQPRMVWHAAVFRAMRETLAGSFAEAERLAASALESGHRAHEPDAPSIYAVQIAAIRREQGRLEELVPLLSGSTSESAAWRCFAAYVQVQSGNEVEARITLDALASEGFAALRRDETWLPAITLSAEVAVALRDRTTARTLYGLLEPYAGRAVVIGLGIGCLGTVSRVLGLLAGLVGDVDARPHFEAALAEAALLGSPHWTAHTRLDFASFLADSSDPADREAAEGLARAAASTYDALGMSSFRDRAEGLMEPGAAQTRVDDDGVVMAAKLRREGTSWDVTFGDASFRVRDTAGLTYLTQLLATPGREIHVADLITSRHRAPRGQQATEPGLLPGRGDAGEILDAEARSQYRRRLQELRDELDEAREFQDPDRAGAAQEEIDALTRALAEAVGLGGRARKASSDAERARLNVTRALRTAIRRLEEICPPLGVYLTKGIRTGTFCAYEPDPRFPVRWTL